MKHLGKARGIVAIGAIAVIVGACSNGAASPSAAPATAAPATEAHGDGGSGVRGPGHGGSGSPRRRPVPDRLFERRRRRQRLPRGAGLHRQGRGAGLRRGLGADVIHRDTDAAGPAGGHPRPDRGGRRRDRLQPERSRRAQPGPRRGARRRHHHRLGRRLHQPRRHLQPLQQPDRVRQARRHVAVREARWRGHRLLHARLRRPPGRHRPRHRLQEASRTTRTSRSSRATKASPPGGIRPTTTQLINDFIASGEYDDINGIWTSGMDSQVVDAIKAAGKAVRADRRRRPRRVRHSCSTTELPGPRGRRGDQHGRRRWRGRQPGAQAPQRRGGRRPPTRPAEHGPARAGGRRQTTDGASRARVVAGRWSRSAVAARPRRSRATRPTRPSRPSPARARAT